MNTDIRLKLSFKDHRKRKKLTRRLGCEAVLALIDLWLSVAENRPDGVLTGMDAEDIAIDSGWSGDPNEFVETLVDVRFIDYEDGVYSLHNWIENNPYASSADERSNKARFKVLKRYFPEIHKRLKDEGVTTVTPEEYKQYTTVVLENTNPTTPSPSPSPSPSPKHKKGGEEPPAEKKVDPILLMADEVLDYLNLIMEKKFKVHGLIPARLRAGATVEECKRVIDIKFAEKGFDRKWIDHTTPFRETNFDKYLNQEPAQVGQDNGGLIYDETTESEQTGWSDPNRNRWAAASS